jgi:hypothetical protein
MAAHANTTVAPEIASDRSNAAVASLRKVHDKLSKSVAKPDWRDLEGSIGDLRTLTIILGEIVETDTGRICAACYDGGEDYAMVLFSKDEAERLSWIAGHIEFCARKLQEDYRACL